MTALERKRQERQRRKEAGYQRVEIWLSPAGQENLEWLRSSSGESVAQVIESALQATQQAVAQKRQDFLLRGRPKIDAIINELASAKPGIFKL